MLIRLRAILLFLFILFLPSQLGYHFWPSWSFVQGLPVDFLSPTIYFTDILILGYIVVSLLINRYFRIPSKSVYVLLIAILFVSFNVIFSQSPFLTIVKWVNLCKYILFAFLVYSQNTSAIPIIRKSLPLAIIWSSILGWCQFISQSSLGGLFWWLGERPLSTTLPGVAIVPSLSLNLFNFTIYTPQLLRAYSTFSHPNSFAGFLLLSLVLIRLLDVTTLKYQPRLLHLSYLIAIFTIPITYSRTAIALLLILLIFSFYSRRKSLSVLILLFSLFLAPYLIKIGNPTALSERLSLVKSAFSVSIEHPLFGAGLGTNPLMLNLPQPVHNLPLLLSSELGYPFTFTILVIILFWLIPITQKHLPLSQSILMGCLIVFMTGLLDHYWLTLNQNMLLLSVFISVSAIISTAPKSYE